MYIKWIGHSCFKIVSKTQSIVVDPYAPKSVPGYKDVEEEANMVYCSHEHQDHNYTQGVHVKPVEELEMNVTKISSYHDDCNGNKRGLNTIHVFEYKGIRVAHLGDLGHMLSDSTIYKLKEIDCLLIPVGGYFTINAETAYEIVRRIKPRIVVPMHYREDKNGYEVLDTVEEFLKYFAENEIVRMSCNTLAVDQLLDGKVVVLTHQ